MPDSKYSVPPGWKKGEPLQIMKRGDRINVEPMFAGPTNPIGLSMILLSFEDYSNFIGFIEWWFK